MFFALVAPCVRVHWKKRVRTTAVGTAAAIGVVAAATMLSRPVRLWLPFVYIAVAYWLPVPLVTSRGGGGFEAWLKNTDEAIRKWARPMPRWLAHVAELGYLTCFPLVPISFTAASAAGSSDDVARFWTATLAAGFVCYGTLPWLPSAPPRIAQPAAAQSPAASLARTNVSILRFVSHGLNTFPSGHVAVSVACALSVARLWPEAGALLSVVAAAVSVGAAAGRYHFIIDVALGAILGTLAALLTS